MTRILIRRPAAVASPGGTWLAESISEHNRAVLESDVVFITSTIARRSSIQPSETSPSSNHNFNAGYPKTKKIEKQRCYSRHMMLLRQGSTIAHHPPDFTLKATRISSSYH